MYKDILEDTTDFLVHNIDIMIEKKEKELVEASKNVNNLKGTIERLKKNKLRVQKLVKR